MVQRAVSINSKSQVFRLKNLVYHVENLIFRIIGHYTWKNLVFRSKNQVFQRAMSNNSKTSFFDWKSWFIILKNLVFRIIGHFTLKNLVFSVHKPSFSWIFSWKELRFSVDFVFGEKLGFSSYWTLGLPYTIFYLHRIVWKVFHILRGYCTSGPYFWRFCAFSQKIKQLWTKYPMDLVRNVPRNSKITILLQCRPLLWSYSEKCAKINIFHVLSHKSITTWVSETPVQ